MLYSYHIRNLVTVFTLSCYIPNNINVPIDLWLTIFNLVTRNPLLCGDFNAFHPLWGSNTFSLRGNHIYNIIDSLSLGIFNNGSPTHIGRPNTTDSALDLPICSPELIWNLSWRTLSEPHGSDHFPIIIKAKLHPMSNINPSASCLDSSHYKPLCYNFHTADWLASSNQILNSVSALPDNMSSKMSCSTSLKL